MEGVGESGWKVQMDAGKPAGGKGNGAKPTELLIMAIGGCSGIDIISILNKQRQEVENFGVELEAERAATVPKVFEKVHVHYVLEGDLDAKKVRRAIELSLEKYCSVSIMVEKTASLSYSFSVNGERYD